MDYFRTTFCSDLMCNKILKVINSLVGVEFLTFNVLLRTKSEQKVIGILFFKNLLKTTVSIRNIIIKILVLLI